MIVIIIIKIVIDLYRFLLNRYENVRTKVVAFQYTSIMLLNLLILNYSANATGKMEYTDTLFVLFIYICY